jgi:hypothetical protein
VGAATKDSGAEFGAEFKFLANFVVFSSDIEENGFFEIFGAAAGGTLVILQRQDIFNRNVFIFIFL